MEGDLNLSQALGGLRIANNVDTPPTSPRLPPQPLEQDPPQRINHNASDYSTYDDTTPTSPALPRGQPAGEYFPPPQRYQQSSTHQASSASSRPLSTFNPYSPNMSDGGSTSAPLSQSTSPQYPDYSRISREPSRASLPGPPPAGTWHPSRERSGSDRSFRQSAQLPPRGSSRGSVPGYGAGSAATGEPYGLPNGPLHSSEEWKERGAAVAIRKEIDRNGNQTSRVVKKGVKDFNFGRTLGEGSYSTVLAATDRTTLKEYAIKVLDKRHIIKEKKVKYVNIEKNTLNRLGEHPGIVRLYYTFQDERSLYFVLDLAAGGELLGFLKRMATFDEECTRFYAGQILDAVEYMHSRGVIHRDLKPENVLLDEKMHVKITDFGTAKILDIPKKPTSQNGMDNISNGFDPMSNMDDTRASSFVGTAEYVSPELLTDKAACKASDLWAFGCIVFQLLSGRPPFKAANEYQTFQKIVNLEYEFPKGFPPVARDLVERLLVLDPAKRLTIDHIKNHPFFEGIEWGRKLWTQKAPRLKAYIPPPEDKIIRLNDGSIGAFRNGVNGSSASVARPPAPPRVITELPPPSQLDIEWSPVLTRVNERILKLGNATVTSAPAPLSPDGKGGLHNHSGTDAPKKLARFFTGVGGGSKKRQRLVMVTTSARVVVAAAGGDDKRMKTEINLLGLGVVIRKVGNASGNVWAIDTRDKTYTFEDSKHSANEWLETCERAKEIAQANFPGDDAYNNSTLSSPASTLAGDLTNSLVYHDGGGDGRNPDHGKSNEKDKKRFSKRHSRHGLAAVF